MPFLRFLTAGESHGKALTGILEGMPAGVSVSAADIDHQLRRRQGGYGRGGRMQIESDHAEILSGVRWGKTTGAPIALQIENKDWQNWQAGMSIFANDEGAIPPVTRPRPGHADLAGALKYQHHDVRNILERSSARETAMRVALGAIARQMLDDFGITLGSYVREIGPVSWQGSPASHASEKSLRGMHGKAEKSPVRCPDAASSDAMVRAIDKARRRGDSLGGVFEVFVVGVPPGLGSHVQWDRKLDGRLAQTIMSIQAIKSVEIGLGFGLGRSFGSAAMDEISYRSGDNQARRARGKAAAGTPAEGSFSRRTNRAGGIEGGISNGMPILLRAAMKPIPTLRKPLRSVDITTKMPLRAAYERSDVCAVPAASVVGEAMVALVIADALLEKFGGDSRSEIMRNYDSYLASVRTF